MANCWQLGWETRHRGVVATASLVSLLVLLAGGLTGADAAEPRQLSRRLLSRDPGGVAATEAEVAAAQRYLLQYGDDDPSDMAALSAGTRAAAADPVPSQLQQQLHQGDAGDDDAADDDDLKDDGGVAEDLRQAATHRRERVNGLRKGAMGAFADATATAGETPQSSEPSGAGDGVSDSEDGNGAAGAVVGGQSSGPGLELSGPVRAASAADEDGQYGDSSSSVRAGGGGGDGYGGGGGVAGLGGKRRKRKKKAGMMGGGAGGVLRLGERGGAGAEGIMGKRRRKKKKKAVSSAYGDDDSSSGTDLYRLRLRRQQLLDISVSQQQQQQHDAGRLTGSSGEDRAAVRRDGKGDGAGPEAAAAAAGGSWARALKQGEGVSSGMAHKAQQAQQMSSKTRAAGGGSNARAPGGKRRQRQKAVGGRSGGAATKTVTLPLPGADITTSVARGKKRVVPMRKPLLARRHR